jgi:uncharacterized protein
MFYLDTSLLVTALSNEDRTLDVQSWLRDQNQSQLVISAWAITEFASALAFKQRTKQITGDHAAKINAAWLIMRKDGLRVAAVDVADFYRAAVMIAESPVALRSGDALHIAIAERYDHKLVTRDQKMLEAAGALGVIAVSP